MFSLNQTNSELPLFQTDRFQYRGHDKRKPPDNVLKNKEFVSAGLHVNGKGINFRTSGRNGRERRFYATTTCFDVKHTAI
jgi:hypothetical protein